MEMSGEAYVQYILDQLDGLEVKGTDNMRRVLRAIHLLEKLKEDIVAHKKPKTDENV